MDAPLRPHKPVRLEVTAGGEPALVPVLDTPARFLGPDFVDCWRLGAS